MHKQEDLTVTFIKDGFTLRKTKLHTPLSLLKASDYCLVILRCFMRVI